MLASVRWRWWAATGMAAAVVACTPGEPAAPGPTTQAPPTTTAEVRDPGLDQEFARLEAGYDARLGVYAVDTASGRTVAHRADERFAYASTFKALAAAVLLAGTTPEQLAEPVPIRDADLLANSPVTRPRAGATMTWRELCDAAIRFSDNTAGNLLLRRVGGPAGLDGALTAVGDDVTSVDRYEPGLNSAVPGDPRDTSTPRAMAGTLRHFALGDGLTGDDRELFVGWLRATTTGDTTVRAGVPAGWTVGDKTGSAGYGGRNDIAVIWPPDRAPIVIALMSARDEPGAERADALLADATRAVLAVLG